MTLPSMRKARRKLEVCRWMTYLRPLHWKERDGRLAEDGGVVVDEFRTQLEAQPQNEPQTNASSRSRFSNQL